MVVLFLRPYPIQNYAILLMLGDAAPSRDACFVVRGGLCRGPRLSLSVCMGLCSRAWPAAWVGPQALAHCTPSRPLGLARFLRGLCQASVRCRFCRVPRLGPSMLLGLCSRAFPAFSCRRYRPVSQRTGPVPVPLSRWPTRARGSCGSRAGARRGSGEGLPSRDPRGRVAAIPAISCRRCRPLSQRAGPVPVPLSRWPTRAGGSCGSRAGARRGVR